MGYRQINVRVRKICVNERGTEICQFNGTELCNSCSVHGGQPYHGTVKRKNHFKGIKIPENLKRIL